MTVNIKSLRYKNMKINTIAFAVAGSLALSSSMSAVASDDIKFFGYANYGMQYEHDGMNQIAVDGKFNGNTLGALGNGGHGGEFGLGKDFTGDNGSVWDVGVMVDEWTGGSAINLAQFWAGGTNLLDSNPDAYFWAGRKFNMRKQSGLNDYYWSMYSGLGVGVDNYDLGAVRLDTSIVQANEGDPSTYAWTARAHDIELTNDLKFEVFGSIGFGRQEITDTTSGDGTGEYEARDTNYQLGTILDYKNGHQLRMMYQDGVDAGNWAASTYFYKEDATRLYVQLEGGFQIQDNTNIAYSVVYGKGENMMYNWGSDNYDADEISLIVRPKHQWNNMQSTWFELGYSQVKFGENTVGIEDGDINSGVKATLQHNWAVGGFEWSRPMLSAYATYGDVSNDAKDTKLDALIAGVKFEAWW